MTDILTTRKADGIPPPLVQAQPSGIRAGAHGPQAQNYKTEVHKMSIGREDYQERKEARIDRMEERAARAQAESSAASHAAHEIMRLIPPGQPILVGHHSERHHRRDLDKIDRNMRKSIEAGEKSAYYSSRAASAASNHAISSDDPDAVEKLEAKLAKLQAAQERDKELNAWYRKHKTMKGCPGITGEDAASADAQLAEMREGIRRPVPAWQLSNRNGEIKRIKDRLAQLRHVDEMEHTEIEFDGGTIISNEDVNRVQILFDEKPDEATRSKLKSNGFRWSRTEGAWQTQRTPQNLRRACYLLGIDPPKPAPAHTADSDDTQDAAPQDEPASTDATSEIQTVADGQALFPLA